MRSETLTPPKPEAHKPIVDMAPILGKVPRIEGVFSPDEEVRKLWLVPKDQKREVVASFKDKLARQREAWALCRTSVEQRIDSNPDLPREEMVGIIREFASNYGFAEPHVKTAEALVDNYIEMHDRVTEVREKFPNDIVLINRLTRMKFTESDRADFEVEVGPLSIEISCSGLNAGKIYEESEDPILFKYRGFESVSGGSKSIYYLIINKDGGGDVYTQIHEQEHQKNRILKPKIYGVSEVREDVHEKLNRGVRGFLRHQINERLLGFERNFTNEIYEKYRAEKDPDKKAFLLAEYMRLEREVALNKAKDEIIASKAADIPYIKKFGSSRYGGKYNIFLDQNSDSYDYLKDLREWDKYSMWKKTAQRVLVDEYGQIIDSAISAFDLLISNGYSQEEVIAMLSDKRLSEWHKTVRRLLEQKEQSE